MTKLYKVEWSHFDSDGIFYKYQDVWLKSHSPNPFLTDKLIYIAQQAGHQVQVAFFYADDVLIGALPFYFKDSHFRMFGEEKSDGLDLIFSKDVSLHDKYELLLKFFSELNLRSASFKKLATYSYNYLIIVKVFRQIGFKEVASVSYKNPIVKHLTETPDYDGFLKIFSKRNTKNYCSKLNREFVYKVTAMEHNDVERVADWMNHFYQQHIQRWNNTKTESIYSYSQNQIILNNKVKAWLENKVGVLFSIDVNNYPIAMAICLKQGDTILYHQISSSDLPIYKSYPKQKILILELAKWMVSNHFIRLDFGIGSENYKYEYANFEREIIQMDFSKTRWQLSHIKSLVNYTYRKNIFLQKLNNEYLKRIVGLLRTLIMRLGYYKKEFQSDKWFFYKKVVRTINNEQMFFYQYKSTTVSNILAKSYKIRSLTFIEVMGFYEKEIVLTLAKRNFYIRKIFEGVDIPYGLFNQQNEVVSIAWLNKAKDNEKPPLFTHCEVYSVDDCYTLRSERGKGYYPILISYVAQLVNDIVLIYTNDWNIASQKGIVKAGFEPIAKRIKKNAQRYEWQ
jgi:hypothetical protein